MIRNEGSLFRLSFPASYYHIWANLRLYLSKCTADTVRASMQAFCCAAYNAVTTELSAGW